MPAAARTRRRSVTRRLLGRQEPGVVHVHLSQSVLPGPARQQDVHRQLHHRTARVQRQRPEVHPVVLEVMTSFIPPPSGTLDDFLSYLPYVLSLFFFAFIAYSIFLFILILLTFTPLINIWVFIFCSVFFSLIYLPYCFKLDFIQNNYPLSSVNLENNSTDLQLL